MEQIWFIDLIGNMELEKRFRIHIGADGRRHVTAEDGNTYMMPDELWLELKAGAAILNEEESQKASRELLKMYKCKLYLELQLLEDAKTSELTETERDIMNALFVDIDIIDIGRRE